MELRVANSFEESGRVVANMFAEVLRHKPNALLGCATGGSVCGVYEELARLHKEEGLDFSGARTVNLDEYAGLAAAHPQSFAYFMREHFFSKVNLRPENCTLVDGAKDPAEQVEIFNDFLARNTIDILMVGIGTNGHIGFNEPDAVFPAAARLVDLDDSTIQANARFFSSEDEVPRRAITMGMYGIVKARRVVLIATGEAKATAIGSLLEKRQANPQLPCSILHLCADATTVIDEALYRRAQNS